MRLRTLAEMTGGLAFFPASLKDLDATYERVVAEIRGAVHARLPLDQRQHRRVVAQGRDQGEAAGPEGPHAPGLLRAVPRSSP